MQKHTLVYDADCGPCTKFKRLVDFLDPRGRFQFTSLVLADEEGLLDPVPVSMRHRSFHLVSPNRRVTSGADALPSLIRLLPLGRAASWFVVSSPGGLRAVAFVYTTLSRLHDSGSCQYKPGRASNPQPAYGTLIKKTDRNMGLLKGRGVPKWGMRFSF